jgi:GT2 family glycosyltransferase
MFRREVVEAVGGFQDPWGADDLDFYLRVAHRFEGRCFNEPAVTRYRRYSGSSSRNGARMLHSMRTVYDRQWPLVEGDPAGEAAWHRGREKLTEIFRDCLAENFRDHVAAGAWRRALECVPLLAREGPSRLLAEAARLDLPPER